jgi:hypothetical protein
MIAVSKSLGATVANGALALAVQDVNGMLTDVFSASVQILTAAGTEVLAKTALDVAVVNRLGLGRYAATWTPGSAAVGQYTVRWYYKLLSASVEQSFDQEFELVAKPYATAPYCSVYDLRAEGLLSSTADDAKVQSWIARASKYIEQFTGQVFVPVYKAMALNGRESRALLLGEPIIGLESVAIDYFTIFGANSVVIPGETLRVFNRHLAGMVNPDDRKNPQLRFVSGGDLGGVNFAEQANSGFLLSQLIFPFGIRNIQVTGLWGYTEADGSFVGQTPFMIREAAKMLVVRLMPQMIDQDGRAEAGQRDRVIQENTRDQGFQFAAPWLKGGLTGSWDIDSILVDHKRPPAMGAA